MFLHYLLSLPENQLLARIYQAQKTNPVKNDWCLQVNEDRVFFSLGVTEEEIKGMTKETFKNLVKEACRKKAFNFLMEEKEKVSSKMGKLMYSELAMQNYLSSQELSTPKKKLLFLLRVRMLKIPNNMGQRNMCSLCEDENNKRKI